MVPRIRITDVRRITLAGEIARGNRLILISIPALSCLAAAAATATAFSSLLWKKSPSDGATNEAEEGGSSGLGMWPGAGILFRRHLPTKPSGRTMLQRHTHGQDDGEGEVEPEAQGAARGGLGAVLTGEEAGVIVPILHVLRGGGEEGRDLTPFGLETFSSETPTWRHSP